MVSIPGLSLAGPPADAIPVEITGELTVLYMDDFKNKRAELQYFIKDKQSKKQYRLQFDGTPPGHLRSGAEVKVRGKAKGKEVYLAADSTDEQSIEIILPAAVSVSGEQRTLVMVANFQDAQVSCSVDEIRDLMFTDPNNQSIDDYYREASQDQIWFAGEVHGTYTIDFSGGCSSPLSEYTDPINAAVEADGVDLSLFDRKVYVVPRPDGCPYAGFGSVGNIPSTAVIFTCGYEDVFAHELGHNLGMHHASTPTSEYGDGTGIMGAGNNGLRHLNAAHQDEMGWRSPAMNVMISESGTYDIAPQSLYEAQSLAPQILRIAKPDTNEYYYIAYRRPLGFDSNLQWWHHDVVTVHRYKGGDGSPTNTYLLDELAVGESFTDAVNNITVSHISQTPDYATVHIDLSGNTTCITGTPQLSFSPASQSANAGSTLNYNVQLINQDSAACSSSTFTLNDNIPTGWTGTLSPSSLSLSPGQTGSAVLSVTSATSATANTYGMGVNVTDSSEANHSATGNASYTVVPSCVAATPSLRLSPSSQSADAGATLGYTISLVNNDNDACGISTFDLTMASLPSGWSGGLSSSSLSLSPGATGTATLSVTSATAAMAGSYSVQVGAADASETLHAKSTTATYVVNDTTPTGDTVTPTAPTGLSSSLKRKQVNLSWNASTDNVGVSGYRLFRDGTLLTDTPDLNYNDRNISSGSTFTYHVIAYDAAGNISAMSNVATVTIGGGGRGGGGKGKKR